MSEHVNAKLRLLRTPGVGPVTFRQLLARFGDAPAAIAALPQLARRGGGEPPRVPEPAVAERELALAARLGGRHLFLGEADYPPLLTELDNAPAALIVRGDIQLLARPTVAVVGARNASAAACRFARQLAFELADAGATVVSGLAAASTPPRMSAACPAPLP